MSPSIQAMTDAVATSAVGTARLAMRGEKGDRDMADMPVPCSQSSILASPVLPSRGVRYLLGVVLVLEMTPR
jgi:hypothetical protein